MIGTQGQSDHRRPSGRIFALPAPHVVAAGILPAVKPGILPGGMMARGIIEHRSGRQDAALYGRQDACRYMFKPALWR
jgi:hypothetical protein